MSTCKKCGFLIDEAEGFCGECMEYKRIIEEYDPVQKPEHYSTGEVECIDAMEAMVSKVESISPHVLYCWQAAFKYIWRWHKKNGIQDIDKCIWYLERMKDKLDIKKTLEEEAQEFLFDTSKEL